MPFREQRPRAAAEASGLGPAAHKVSTTILLRPNRTRNWAAARNAAMRARTGVGGGGLLGWAGVARRGRRRSAPPAREQHVVPSSQHDLCCPGAGVSRSLIDMTSPALVDEPNHHTIEVKSSNFKLRINGIPVFDYRDNQGPHPPRSSPIGHGGILIGRVWRQRKQWTRGSWACPPPSRLRLVRLMSSKHQLARRARNNETGPLTGQTTAAILSTLN
jgi:hypothetical protein